MKKPKSYKIKTIQDIIDCVDEKNIDMFLKDLKQVIISAKIVEEIAKSNGTKATLKNFKWIDDGENDVFLKMPLK